MGYSKTENVSRITNSKTDSDGVLSLPAMFAIGFCTLYLRAFLESTALSSLPESLSLGLLVCGVLALFAHCLLYLKKYQGRILLCLAILIAMLVSYVLSGETAPFLMSLVVIACASVGRISNVVRLWFNFSVFLVLILICMYFVVLIVEPESLNFVQRIEDDGAVSIRLSFFFIHPNTAAAFVMMMCGAFLYLRYDQLSFRDYFIVWVVAVLLLVTTDSRTSSILTAILPVLYHLQKQRGFLSKKRIRTLLGIAPAVLSVGVYVLAGPLFSQAIAGFLTGRVTLWHSCLENQGITVLGQVFQPTVAVGSNGWKYYYATLDSFYAASLLVYGMVFLFLFCLAIWLKMKQESDDLGKELPLLVVMIIFGIVEVHVLSIAICFPILFLSDVVMRNKVSSVSASEGCVGVKND